MRALPSLAAVLVMTSTAAAQVAPTPAPAAPAPPTPAPAAPPAVEPAAPAAAPDPVPVHDEPARADYGETVMLAGSTSDDLRSYAKDWMVAPPGYNIGGELRFITAATSPDGPRIHFTDMALLRMHARWTASKRIELAGSIDLLAKQPDTRKDFLLQGGNLAMKIATSHATAISAGVSGGPTMGDTGLWGSLAAGVVHRSRIEEFLAFQYSGGAVATALREDKLDPRWEADLAASSELVFHTPRGEWAMWLGCDLGFPVAHSSGLDPRSRLGVSIGTIFAAVQDWDIYTEFTWRDRGTTTLPATTLPIVDGGFDQRQLVVGITRRFTARGQGTLWALAQ
jgi:hypothetical protein